MKVTVLTGGVGGAKLVLGLTRVLPPEQVTAIVNTGDDFRHLGLHVSPDIDTLLYTLSGKANPAQGWGRAGETWSFMAALRELGGEDWFLLGDGDLALHVLRSAMLADSIGLSRVTARFAEAWGLRSPILPMTEQTVATTLETSAGRLDFQRYFVEQRCQPSVGSIDFAGAAAAEPAPGVEDAIAAADAVLVAPSNPFLSIDPILAVPGILSALRSTKAPVVAVSPIVGGKAVKGPTAKLMQELGMSASNASVVAHYRGLLRGLLIHAGDDSPPGVQSASTDTMMHTIDDKARVAEAALALAARVGRA